MRDEQVQSGDEEHTDQEHADAKARQRVVVGLVGDPDLPASVARRFPDVLPALRAPVTDRREHAETADVYGRVLTRPECGPARV
jgi:hypothetical protein